jgi:hypothetical protein
VNVCVCMRACVYVCIIYIYICMISDDDLCTLYKVNLMVISY